jgi:uncharacterized membrane protein
MKKFVFFFTVLLIATGLAVAQESGRSSMQGMMKGEEGGMGMMGMMKMMEQCNSMMKTGHQSQESALDILKKRYAKGEITVTESENMKKQIQ